MGQVQVLARIHAVEPGAHHGDGGRHGASAGCCFQGPFMCCCVHTQRQPRHDGQAGATQRAGEKAGVFCALGRGVAAANHGEAAVAGKGLVLQQQRRAHEVQQQRRVFRVQQGLGIAQVAQAHDGACRPLWRSTSKPLGGGLPQGFPTLRNLAQRLGLRSGHAELQRGFSLLKDGLGQAKACQEAPCSTVADARRQGQPQPSAELVVVHGCQYGAAT